MTDEVSQASRTRVLAAVLVVGAAFGVYAGALGNGFVWDDSLVLERQLPLYDSSTLR